MENYYSELENENGLFLMTTNS